MLEENKNNNNMKYIIASIEGTRYDFAPKYNGSYGRVYHFRHFKLLIWKGGDYEAEAYEKAYEEIAAYVTKVNDELANNRYYRGWCYAEMLTPKEQHQYNDIRCHLFHSWLVDKILNCYKVSVSKTNVCDKDIRNQFDSIFDFKEVAKIARAISNEMLLSIELPGEFHHNLRIEHNENELWDPELPIFQLGYTLPYSIQLH